MSILKGPAVVGYAEAISANDKDISIVKVGMTILDLWFSEMPIFDG